MKRTRFPGRPKLPRDAERLARLAIGLADSGSRIEDNFWERRLVELVDRMLEAGNDAALESALDQLWAPQPRAYDRLIDLVEARTEGGLLDRKGTAYDGLMFAVPVLAWSRYSIPSGPLAQSVLDNLRVQLQAHVLATGASLWFTRRSGFCEKSAAPKGKAMAKATT